jgi:hypothetical protein
MKAYVDHTAGAAVSPLDSPAFLRLSSSIGSSGATGRSGCAAAGSRPVADSACPNLAEGRIAQRLWAHFARISAP